MLWLIGEVLLFASGVAVGMLFRKKIGQKVQGAFAWGKKAVDDLEINK